MYLSHELTRLLDVVFSYNLYQNILLRFHVISINTRLYASIT